MPPLVRVLEYCISRVSSEGAGKGRRGGMHDTDRMLLASYAQVPQEGEGGVGGEKAGEAVAMDVSDDEDDDSSDRLRGASVAASVVRKKEEAIVTSRARCESTDEQLLAWLCGAAGRDGRDRGCHPERAAEQEGVVSDEEPGPVEPMSTLTSLDCMHRLSGSLGSAGLSEVLKRELSSRAEEAMRELCGGRTLHKVFDRLLPSGAGAAEQPQQEDAVLALCRLCSAILVNSTQSLETVSTSSRSGGGRMGSVLSMTAKRARGRWAGRL